MSEHALDRAQADTSRYSGRGEAVPQIMDARVLDLCGGQCPHPYLPDVIHGLFWSIPRNTQGLPSRLDAFEQIDRDLVQRDRQPSKSRQRQQLCKFGRFFTRHGSYRLRYVTAPVAPIASAPQIRTRTAPWMMGAPPARSFDTRTRNAAAAVLKQALLPCSLDLAFSLKYRR